MKRNGKCHWASPLPPTSSLFSSTSPAIYPSLSVSVPWGHWERHARAQPYCWASIEGEEKDGQCLTVLDWKLSSVLFCMQYLGLQKQLICCRYQACMNLRWGYKSHRHSSFFLTKYNWSHCQSCFLSPKTTCLWVLLGISISCWTIYSSWGKISPQMWCGQSLVIFNIQLYLLFLNPLSSKTKKYACFISRSLTHLFCSIWYLAVFFIYSLLHSTVATLPVAAADWVKSDIGMDSWLKHLFLHYFSDRGSVLQD